MTSTEKKPDNCEKINKMHIRKAWSGFNWKKNWMSHEFNEFYKLQYRKCIHGLSLNNQPSGIYYESYILTKVWFGYRTLTNTMQYHIIILPLNILEIISE